MRLPGLTLDFSLKLVIRLFIMNVNCQKTSSEVAVDYRACVYPVPHVPLTVDETQPIEGGIKQLLKHIRPEWPTERVQFKVTLWHVINLSKFFVVSC